MESHKLQVFLVQCKLNYQDRPLAFVTDCAKVIFVQSYLKGMQLDWLVPDLLYQQDPLSHPLWMDNFKEFKKELRINFGPHNPVGNTKTQLIHLSMKDGQHITKHVIEFN
jgi:hypothetical protein